MSQQQETVNITSLPAEKLSQILRSLEEELQFLTQSHSQLKLAATKYSDTRSCMESLGEKNKGKEIFVPLTSSLYVKGKLSNPSKVTVDIGTGYFVEKNIAATEEFTERKIAKITESIDKLTGTIEAKRNQIVQVQMVLRAKMVAGMGEGGTAASK